MGRDLGRAGPMLHPTYLGAVAVLAVNDHVLKDAWPGLVTGKLSDLAGVFVVGVLAAVLLGHRTVALTATAVAFTALKTSATVAGLAAPVLGGVTSQDPTDLVGLLVLGPAAVYLRRFETAPTPRGDRQPSEGRRDATNAIRRLGLVVAGGVTAFTITATSCLEGPEVEALGAYPAGIMAIGTFGNQVSTDGGITWTPEPGAQVRRIDRQEACIDGERCFRVADNDRVEERIDGGWVTTFSFTDEELRRMQMRARSTCSGASSRKMFESIAAADTPDGETIVVAMASQGVLRLDPATDTWSRHAVGSAEPLSTSGPRWLLNLALSPVVLFLLGPVMMAVSRGGTVPVGRRVTAMCLAMSIGAVLSAGALFVWGLGSPDYVSFGVGLAVISVVVFLASLAIVLPKGRPKPSPTPQPAGPSNPPPPWDTPGPGASR